MQVTVKLFATLRQVTGWSKREVEIAEDATIGTLLEILTDEYPALNLMGRTVYAAVGEEYVQVNQPLQEGDDVALFPPVSGGCNMDSAPIRWQAGNLLYKRARS